MMSLVESTHSERKHPTEPTHNKESLREIRRFIEIPWNGLRARGPAMLFEVLFEILSRERSILIALG
jgi:hypothetical protein